MQSSLKELEEGLEERESELRSAVHEARNSVMGLRYKIHDMESERLSNAMFGGASKGARPPLALTHTPPHTHTLAPLVGLPSCVVRATVQRGRLRGGRGK